jgi:hypothetical protein
VKEELSDVGIDSAIATQRVRQTNTNVQWTSACRGSRTWMAPLVSQSFEWLHAVLLEHMEPDVPCEISQTNVSTTPSRRSEHWLDHTTRGIRSRHRRQLRKQPARVPKPIPRSDGRFRVARAFFVARLPSVMDTGGTDLPQEFDVVCLGGGVAGEAIAVGLRDSGLSEAAARERASTSLSPALIRPRPHGAPLHDFHQGA